MGYCIDVHICVSKGDLPILFSFDDMDLFTCSYRDENIVYAYATGLKLNDWWTDLKKIIEQCKEYHWITIGEDGIQNEDYSHEPMMSVITTIDVPPLIKPIIESTDKLYKELVNVLNLSLPKEFKVWNKGYIDYKQVILAYMYTIEDRVYVRRYVDSLDNCPELFKDVLNILSNNYTLIRITPIIYEIKYKS